MSDWLTGMTPEQRKLCDEDKLRRCILNDSNQGALNEAIEEFDAAGDCFTRAAMLSDFHINNFSEDNAGGEGRRQLMLHIMEQAHQHGFIEGKKHGKRDEITYNQGRGEGLRECLAIIQDPYKAPELIPVLIKELIAEL